MGNLESQLKAIAIAPKFPALLSILGSLLIVMHVIYGRQKRNTHHRLLMGMSVCDLIVSMAFLLGTWPMPRGSPMAYDARGNIATCNFQGFMAQFGLAVPLYNCTLSFYYLFKIRYGWSWRFIERMVEPVLHAVPIVIGLSTAMAGLFLKQYNNDNWECYISPYPLNCKESWTNGGKTTCIRGDNASIYRWMFYGAELWLAIVLVSINMFLVYRSVARQEASSRRFDMTASTRSFKHSKRVAMQGYWYCGAFYLAWIFPTITRITQLVVGDATPFALLFINALFVPIQGFFNFLVYIHPRWPGIRESLRRNRSTLGLVRRMFRSSSSSTGANNEIQTTSKARESSKSHSQDDSGGGRYISGRSEQRDSFPRAALKQNSESFAIADGSTPLDKSCTIWDRSHGRTESWLSKSNGDQGSTPFDQYCAANGDDSTPLAKSCTSRRHVSFRVEEEESREENSSDDDEGDVVDVPAKSLENTGEVGDENSQNGSFLGNQDEAFSLGCAPAETAVCQGDVLGIVENSRLEAFSMIVEDFGEDKDTEIGPLYTSEDDTASEIKIGTTNMETQDSDFLGTDSRPDYTITSSAGEDAGLEGDVSDAEDGAPRP